MRPISTRALLLSSAGLVGAVLWGAIECLALFRSRLMETLGLSDRFHTP